METFIRPGSIVILLNERDLLVLNRIDVHDAASGQEGLCQLFN